MIRNYTFTFEDLYPKLNGTWEFFIGDKYIKIYKGMKTASTNFIINSKYLQHIPNNYKITIYRQIEDNIPFTRSVIVRDDKGNIIIRMFNPQEVNYSDDDYSQTKMSTL